MKHFIYMDTDILNSYISQFNDGLPTNRHEEIVDQTTTNKSETNTEPITNESFRFSIPQIFNIGSENKGELISATNTLTQLQSGKELIDKLIHDNAFNQLVKYLNDNNLLKNQENYDIGDYIIIKNRFEFWDMDYLVKIFGDNFVQFFINTSVNEFKQQFAMENNGKQPSSNNLKQNENVIKDNFKSIQDILKIATDIMPFTKFMMIQDNFVPLNEKFLRESITNIRFKYTGEITLIGEYTNNYKGLVQPTGNVAFSQIFGTIDHVVNSFLKESINIPNYAKVITPIALYFE